MRWYDYWAIFVAIVLALWADYDANRALRASLVTYLALFEGDAWIRAADLRHMFGSSVYRHLHKLAADGVIERREEPGGPERGNRANAFYRWKEQS